MKKYLIPVSLCVFALIGQKEAYGQGNTIVTNVTVNVTAAQGLTVSEPTAGENTQVSDKIDGVNNVKLGQVTQVNVFSTGKFTLKVGARNNLELGNGNEIPASAVFVSSAPSSNDLLAASDYVFEKDVNLSLVTPKPLIHSETKGALNTSFEVEFYASGLDYEDLKNANLDGTVVYTIEVD